MSQVCQDLHRMLSGLHRYSFPFAPEDIPQNGIYVLYEQGETGHGVDRIVRVGTHTGHNQLPGALWARLQQHFTRENKDRSIFRKNIGRALLNRDGDPFLAHWELDRTSRRAKEQYAGVVDLDQQAAVERRVTQTIQENFSLVVLPVEDKEERLALESGLISTVSWCEECRPSTDWLGLHSPKQKIRESGLWLVNELYKEPLSDIDLVALQTRISVVDQA
ncbi:hypothetical protein LCGC14_2296120 [marine sediment metagenome]|uniref:GIY-YIG domain-containing protein n=1 Tax=marine sediment metagenome TaxID=412755 RepID=A0A0F9CPU7_9ZZZZ